MYMLFHKYMLVHKQVTVSNSFVFPVITYVFNGNIAVVMHVQLQICIIATQYLQFTVIILSSLPSCLLSFMYARMRTPC